MPAPSSSNALTLGRPLVDKSAFRPDTDPAVIRSFELVHQTMVGMGWPSPAFDGDTAYLGVFAFDNGDGTHTLYGGSPTDPTNPSALSISGGATISVSDEGTPLGGAFTTLDFVGAGVTATDAGGGTATITIGGGGGGTYTAGDGLDLTASEFSVIGYEGIVVDGNGVSVELATDPGLEFDAAGAAGKLRAKAGTYIDVDSNGISVDLTEIAGYSVASAFQIIKHESGTLGWGNYTAGTGISITDGTIECTVVDTDTTYTAGQGITLSGTEFSAKIATENGIEFNVSNEIAVNEGPGIAFYDTTSSGGAVKSVGVEFDSDTHLGWDTDPGATTDSSKLAIVWDGMTDWDNAEYQTLIHESAASAPNIPIWADLATETFTVLDPNGGHTITTSGNTLTLTLKCIRYTARLIKTAEIADDQVINYTGTNCP